MTVWTATWATIKGAFGALIFLALFQNPKAPGLAVFLALGVMLFFTVMYFQQEKCTELMLSCGGAACVASFLTVKWGVKLDRGLLLQNAAILTGAVVFLSMAVCLGLAIGRLANVSARKPPG